MKTPSCRSFPRPLWLCAVALLLGLGACQSPPPPPAPAPPPVVDQAALRAEVLRAQGFVRVDDNWELQMNSKLLFESNVDEMTGEARQTLLSIGHALADVGISRLRVEGHADDRGTAVYNEKLSQRRAQWVADALVEAGIPRDNIEVRGYGASRPLVAGATDAARKENRRVALIIPAQ